MASLNDVCFERIRDTFYYGMFGEFKLVVDKSTGCFNATKLCKDGGKEFRQWMRLEKSKRLIEYYESRCGDPHVGSDYQSRPSYMRVGSDFYEVKGDNKDALVAKTTGQYVRKELILDIASWVSVEFYDKCNQIIIDFYAAEYKKSLKQKDDKIDELNRKLDEMMKQNDRLLKYAEDTNTQLTHLTETVEDHNETLPEKLVDVLRPIASNLVKAPVETALKGRFVVLSLGRRQYRIARGQNRSVTRVIGENPDATIVLDLPLVGAQDRMTEVRRKIRQDIADDRLGRARFTASLVTNLTEENVTQFLRSILDVHEEFESIPLDVIRAARHQLAI
jgi:KilA-N domain